MALQLPFSSIWHDILSTIYDQYLVNRAKGQSLVLLIGGGVSVGKTTFASNIAQYLPSFAPSLKVQVVSTDHFLYDNQRLNQLDLKLYKGFPRSYDNQLIQSFCRALNQGKPLPTLPVYNHEQYNHMPNQTLHIKPFDILIIEGIIALNHAFWSLDALRFFLFAHPNFMRQWYVSRFMRLRYNAIKQQSGYFLKFANYSEQEAMLCAEQTWAQINWPNWLQHIYPTISLADIILNKQYDHTFSFIKKNR